jgi:hypothetical protein
MKTRLYPLLPFVVCAYVVLCFALHPFSPFTTHHLADPDDTMRLDQVIAWMQGQSWYDLSVPRLSAGAHTVIHWSRLIDLPIALCAYPFIPLFGLKNAVFVAALIVPLAWFVVLLVLVAALAEVFVGRARANLATVMVLFAPMLLFDFTPGHVDHHGAQAVIAGFGLLSLGKIITGDQGRLYAVLAALIFACGFWIGAEALPWAILFIACAGVASAWLGGKVARDAALFGLLLPLFCAALVPIALPAAEFSSRALSWFSPAYVLFAALAGGILIVGWALGRFTESRWLRVMLYAACALAAGMAFFAAISSALSGPFADYDHFDATIALDNITEATPLSHALRFNRYMPASLVPALLAFLRLIALPLAGLATCFVMARKACGKEPRLRAGRLLPLLMGEEPAPDLIRGRDGDDRAAGNTASYARPSPPPNPPPSRGRAFRSYHASHFLEPLVLVYLSNAVFLAAAMALTVFWQMRVGIFMEIFALAPLTALLVAGWDWLRWGLWDRRLFWAEIGLFLLLGPLPVVILPAILHHAPLYPDTLLFPVARGAAPCQLDPVLPTLNDPHGLGASPLTIMNISDTGPELLFSTRHNVIAGNFDVAGNADAFTFFHALNDNAAQAAAQRWHADLVLICKTAPSLYLGKDYFSADHTRLKLGADGKLHYTNIDAAQPLIERLIRGQIPSWLKPIEIPDSSDYLLFEIQKTMEKQ